MINFIGASEYILASDISTWIAKKLQPLPERKEPTFKKLDKGIPIDAMKWRCEWLSNADEDLLINLFNDAGLDFEALMIQDFTKSQWKPFEQAFEQSENKPDWDIFIEFKDPYRDAFQRQWDLGVEHQILLEKAANDGIVKILSSDRIPTTKIELGSIISREDAEKYLKGLGFSLSDALSNDKKNTKIDNALTQNITEKKTKLEKQQEAILNVIQNKQFNPMKIPDTAKGIIKTICENEYPEDFDGSTSFDRAWSKGRKTLWKMEYHDSYAKRGNN